eukprot:536307_1
MTLIHSELELITWYYSRTECEEPNNHRISVPVALKYLICNYLKKLIQSKILTMDEEDNFLKIKVNYGLKFFKQIPTMKLLFRASEHNFSAKQFHKFCDNKGPTLVIIESNYGHVFGGYTTNQWKSNVASDCSYLNEPPNNEAFLFVTRSSISYQQTPKVYADPSGIVIKNHKYYAISILDKCNKSEKNYSYLDGDNVGNELCGGNKTRKEGLHYFFKVIDYEVFECSNK